MSPELRKANVAVERMALEFSRAAATGSSFRIFNAAHDLKEATEAAMAAAFDDGEAVFHHLTHEPEPERPWS